MEKQIVTITIQTQGDRCEMTDEEIKDWYLSNIARLFDPAYGTPTIEVALERQRIFPRLLLCAIEGVPPQDNFDIEKNYPDDVGDRLWRVMQWYDARDAEMMRRRFVEGESYQKIADWCGITRERVRQVIESMLRKLCYDRVNDYLHGKLAFEDVFTARQTPSGLSRKRYEQRAWSKEELDAMRQELETADVRTVARAHHRSARAVARAIYEYGLLPLDQLPSKMPPEYARAYQHWTEEETAELVAQYNAGATILEMARAHRRTRTAIWAQLPLATGKSKQELHAELSAQAAKKSGAARG